MNRPTDVSRPTLFAGTTLQIGLFVARPRSDACGDVERQASNAIVLPFNGVFEKHEARGRSVLGTPCHAVFVAADTPYRISFPGAIGDRALILRFDETLAPHEISGSELAPNGLLGAEPIMLRNALLTRLRRAEPEDDLEITATALDLLRLSVDAMRREYRADTRASRARRSRAIARVKEVVAVAPARK